MPRKPPTPCRTKGCSRLVSTPGFCPVHDKGWGPRRRLPHQAGAYGSDLRKIRAQVIKEQPTCAVEKCSRPSVDVHHRVALQDGGNNERSNLEGLCHPHHSAETLRERRARGQMPGRA